MPNTLLPLGLRDLLPQTARKQQHIFTQFLTVFELFGYDQVSPPLIEQTTSLFSGKGNALRAQTFCMTDPLSGNMLGLRADMTTQISRIARSRLVNNPLPMRLSYAGSVLRSHPGTSGGERQLDQAGIEYIGTEGSEAEVIIAALEALSTVGLNDVFVDLKIGGLLDIILDDSIIGLTSVQQEKRDDIIQLINQKSLSSLPNDLACLDIIGQLMNSIGPAQRAVEMLSSIILPEAAAPLIANFKQTVEQLQNSGVEIQLSADILENNGFEYHHGVCFSLFLARPAKEIGRGGSYTISRDDTDGPETSEVLPACGVTLYVDRLIDSAQIAAAPERIYAPHGTQAKASAELRKQGYQTIHGMLQHDGDAQQDDAKRLGCSGILRDGKVSPLA